MLIVDQKLPSWLLKKAFNPADNLEIFIGQKQAVQVRIDGWREIKKENLILIAPEATLNLPLPKSVKARQKAVSQKKIKTQFIENINSPGSLVKNLKRIGQGIEVRHLNHHGYSFSIRDEKVVVLEYPLPGHELINFKIFDNNLAKQLKKFYLQLWQRAVPLTPGFIKKLQSSWS